jgi:hypothetical protein
LLLGGRQFARAPEQIFDVVFATVFGGELGE